MKEQIFPYFLQGTSDRTDGIYCICFFHAGTQPRTLSAGSESGTDVDDTGGRIYYPAYH